MTDEHRHALLATIETASVRSDRLTDYAAVSIAFEVRGRLLAVRPHDQAPFRLTEGSAPHPYTKDYDAHGETPIAWSAQFDTSRWTLFLARVDRRCVGGATLAVHTPGLDMLEGRDDLAVLWDIRVDPTCRGRGVGRSLFRAVEAAALAQGCRELKVETQNINVSACRFYAALGCQLRTVREQAYPACPGEVQFLWYKTLTA